MQWVELVPTFEARYPGKRMVLVLDNAPYHHKRGIETLPTTKAKMLEMMRKHNVTAIQLPAREGYRAQSAMVPVTDAFKEKSIKSKPLVPNLDEMKHGFLHALRSSPDKSQRDKLDDKVVTFLRDRPMNHQLIWTPPYCPGVGCIHFAI